MRSSAVIAALLLLLATSAMAQNVVAPSGSIGGVGSLKLGSVSINEPVNPVTVNAAAPGTCPTSPQQFEIADTTAGPLCLQVPFSALSGTATNSQLLGPLVSLLAVPAQFTIANPAGVGTATIGYTANSLAAHNFGTGLDSTGKLTGAQPSFSDLLGTLGTGQFTATTCTNQFVSALSNSGAATCTTDTLASAQHANQGTTTTVLHGNAAGNPSWASVADADLANGYSGTGACAANKFETADNRNAVPTCTQPAFSNLSGNPTATQLGITTFLLKGTGAGDYTTTSTTAAVVDATNLQQAVTIPTGSKLIITAVVSFVTSNAADNAIVGIADGSTVLDTQYSTITSGLVPAALPPWAITGDGLSHTVKLVFANQGGGATTTIKNSTPIAGFPLIPTMVLHLVPSN